MVVACLVFVPSSALSGTERSVSGSQLSTGGIFAVELKAAESPGGALFARSFELVGTLSPAAAAGTIFTNGFESGDLSGWAAGNLNLPSGAVSFYWGTACPNGWSVFQSSRGRAILGTPQGGSVGGSVGSQVADMTAVDHSHVISGGVTTTSSPTHNHWWATLTTDKRWWSFGEPYSGVTLIQWTDGMDNDGGGYFPFESQVPSTNYTDMEGPHNHQLTINQSTQSESGNLPYVQLLVCEKD